MAKEKTASVVYFTAHRPPQVLASMSRTTIFAAATESTEFIGVGWRELEDMEFDKVITTGKPRRAGTKNLFEQMLVGLEAASTDTVYFAEDDVLYPPGAWEWMDHPKLRAAPIAYNMNVAMMNREGFWLQPRWVNSGCAGNRDEMIRLVKIKLDVIERGERIRYSELARDTGMDGNVWRGKTKYPFLDVRWGQNFTGYRKAAGDQYLDELPCWGKWKPLAKFLGLKEKQGNATEWANVVSENDAVL